MTDFEQDARAALEAKGEAERRLAAAADCPMWRHAAFALIMSGLVAAPALAMPLRLAVPVLMLVAIVAIVQSDRRRTGMFINGYRRGKTLMITFPLLIVELGLYLLSMRAGENEQVGTVILLAVAAFVVAMIGSIAWQNLFVREMRG